MRPVPKARIKLGGGANVKFTKNGTSLTRSVLSNIYYKER